MAIIKGNRIGEVFETKTSGKVEITDYNNSTDLTVKFLDDSTILKGVTYSSLKRGTVRNHNVRRVYGVGYMGFGEYSFTTHKKLYKMWVKMFERSYCKIYHKTRPTYIGCSVDEKWHCFQDFVEWVKENYNEYFLDSSETLILDKDIKFKGNKIYSPLNTYLVDNRLNVLFTKSDGSRGDLPIGVSNNKFGKFCSAFRSDNKLKHLGTFESIDEAFIEYKKAKEKYIKELSEEYLNEKLFWMNKSLHQSLNNYIVEITD